ncbi:MAG: 2-oxoglutarate dehydrogenase E1 subunit family protein, partial [Steroidobacteraceae bacterium]
MTEPKPMLTATPLAAGNDAYVEAMYERYLAQPDSVAAHWREYFASLGPAGDDVAHGPLIEELARRAKVPRHGSGVAGAMAGDAGSFAARPAGSPPAGDSAAAKQGAVSRLIQIYSNRGHLIANIDPLGLTVRPVPKVLGLDYLGLTETDLDTEFLTGSRHEAIKPRLKLREIIAQLQHIYCG